LFGYLDDLLLLPLGLLLVWWMLPRELREPLGRGRESAKKGAAIPQDAAPMIIIRVRTAQVLKLSISSDIFSTL
jgi:hypothetical protein